MARLSLIFVLPLLIACAPSTKAPICVEKYAWTELSEQKLTDHNGFDWFDSALRKGQPVWDGYDAVLKVAPKNVLARMRAAWALEFIGPTDKKAPAQAFVLLQTLKKDLPNDKDVRFLDLAMSIERIQRHLAPGSGTRINELLQAARAFNSEFPNYIGPHGVKAGELISVIGKMTGNNGMIQ